MPSEAVGVIKKPRFFHGWLIVLVGFLGDFVMAGVSVHSFGFILKPMTGELGWTRSMTMLGASMRTVTGAFSGLILGPLLDRYGARLIMVFGALVAGGGIMLLSRITEIWQFYVIYGLMGAVGMVAIGGFVTNAAVAKWFIRRRGRAMAIVAAGLPLGGAVLAPITQYFILHFDWRTAWLVLGLLAWIIIIPVAWLFMRRTPEDMGLLPDGEEILLQAKEESKRNANIAERVAPKLEETWTLKEAIRTPTLWMVILAFDLSGMGLSASIYHQTAYISDKGLPPAMLATNIVVFGIAAAVGSLLWGFLSERYPVRFCVSACFFASAIGLAILIATRTPAMVLVYGVAFGLAAGGSAPLNTLTIANYYGRAFIGTIQGMLMPFRLISTAGGPLFAAYIYDTTKSYDLAFTIFAVTYLLGALMILLARPPKRKQASGQG